MCIRVAARSSQALQNEGDRARVDGVRAEAGRGGSLACPHAGFSEFRREPLGERLRTFFSFTRTHWPK